LRSSPTSPSNPAPGRRFGPPAPQTELSARRPHPSKFATDKPKLRTGVRLPNCTATSQEVGLILCKTLANFPLRPPAYFRRLAKTLTPRSHTPPSAPLFPSLQAPVPPGFRSPSIPLLYQKP